MRAEADHFISAGSYCSPKQIYPWNMNDSVRRVKRAGLEERESAKNKRGGSSKQDNAKTDEVPEGFRLVRSWNPRKCWTSLVREFSAASGGRERHGATLRRNKVHEVAKRVENSGPGRRTSSAVTLGEQGKQTYARLALTYVMVKTLAHAVLLHPLLQQGPARSEVGARAWAGSMVTWNRALS